jgi:uncharacterized protein (TIGR02996 family)
MNDEEALLREIRKDLDEDIIRLAYADWLQDTKPGSTQVDHDLADFIRTQIKLANTPPLTRTHAELQAETNKLLKKHRLTWLRGAFPGVPTKTLEEMQDDFTFERGFPSRLRVIKENFQNVLEHAGGLFNGTCIDTLDVRHIFGFLPTLMKRLDEEQEKAGQAGGAWKPPRFATIVLEIFLAGPVGFFGWAGAYSDPATANVDELNALATRPEFSKLRMLRINNDSAEGEYTAAFGRLMSSPNMAHLQRLELGSMLSDNSPLSLHGCTLPALRYFGMFSEEHEFGNKESLPTAEVHTGRVQNGPRNPVFESLEFVDFSGTASSYGEDTHERRTQICDTLINAWCEHCPKLKGMALSREILYDASDAALNKLVHKVETLRVDGTGGGAEAVAVGITANIRRMLAQTHSASTLKELQITGVRLTTGHAKQLLDQLPKGAWLNAELTETQNKAAAEVLNRMDARREPTLAASPPPPPPPPP